MDKKFLKKLVKGQPETPMIDSNLFYSPLFQHNPDIVIFMDVFGVIARVDGESSETFGYSPKEIEQFRLEHFLETSDIFNYKREFKKALNGETTNTCTTFINKNGDHTDITIHLIPTSSEDRVIGVFGIIKDVTDIKRAKTQLAESELKFNSIVDHALFGVYILQEDGRVIYGNHRFYEQLQIEDRTEVNFRDYVHPEEIEKLEALGKLLIKTKKGQTHHYRMIKNDGTIIDVESHSAKIRLQNKPHIVGSLRDITQQKKSTELNEYLAYNDYLTDLPNQRLFANKIEEGLIISKALDQPLTVMMIDLDRFKYVNDSLGHSIGNKLLKAVAKRLDMCRRDEDVLARIGGDEFAIFLPNMGNTSQVVDVAKTMIETVEQPFYIEQYELFITASIGISIFPNDGEDAETLIKHADSALYKAKDKGKNTYQIFTSAMNAESYKIFTLESDLRKALELDQLELYYQAQICSTTNEIIGVEALIRWNHPEWGLVYPKDFIPIAEETGLIMEMSKWVKETACVQLKAWQDAGLPKIPMSINLSAHRFLEKDLLENITRNR